MKFTPSLRFFRRSRTPSLEQDPADMGTAFGMEASLDGSDDYRINHQEFELESQRASSTPESPLAWLSRRSN